MNKSFNAKTQFKYFYVKNVIKGFLNIIRIILDLFLHVILKLSQKSAVIHNAL
jgi:hypothetical protein